MRTTVEISDDLRARLLQRAARRGEKGFSRLVNEALEQYLDAEADRTVLVRAAVDAIGSLTDAQADRLVENVARLRATWR